EAFGLLLGRACEPEGVPGPLAHVREAGAGAESPDCAASQDEGGVRGPVRHARESAAGDVRRDGAICASGHR
ncbi:MAG: hypothetical protein ACFFDT_08485, partial [Candidatus Hodarchaeota archaeon]